MLRLIATAVVVVRVASRPCKAGGGGDFTWIDPEPAVAVVLFGGSELEADVRKTCTQLAGDKELKLISVTNRMASVERFLIRPPELPEAIIGAGPLDEQQRERIASALSERRDCVGVVIEPD